MPIDAWLWTGLSVVLAITWFVACQRGGLTTLRVGAFGEETERSRRVLENLVYLYAAQQSLSFALQWASCCFSAVAGAFLIVRVITLRTLDLAVLGEAAGVATGLGLSNRAGALYERTSTKLKENVGLLAMATPLDDKKKPPAGVQGG